MRLLVFLGCLGAAAIADDVTTRAAEHFRAGQRLYNLSEWDAALQEFRGAYLLKPDPSFLFNIGQCQRQLSQFEAAENSYRAFLRESPDLSATLREQVNKLIGQMEQAVKEKRMHEPPTGIAQPTETPTVEPSVSAPSPAPAAVVVSRSPIYKRWWLWTAVGAAAVALGVGLGVGLAPRSTSYPNAGGADATFRF